MDRYGYKETPQEGGQLPNSIYALSQFWFLAKAFFSCKSPMMNPASNFTCRSLATIMSRRNLTGEREGRALLVAVSHGHPDAERTMLTAFSNIIN